MKKEQKTNFGLKYINNIMKKIPFKPSTTPVTAKHSRKTSKEKKKNTCFNSNVSKAKQPQTKSLSKIKNIVVPSTNDFRSLLSKYSLVSHLTHHNTKMKNKTYTNNNSLTKSYSKHNDMKIAAASSAYQTKTLLSHNKFNLKIQSSLNTNMNIKQNVTVPNSFMKNNEESQKKNTKKKTHKNNCVNNKMYYSNNIFSKIHNIDFIFTKFHFSQAKTQNNTNANLKQTLFHQHHSKSNSSSKKNNIKNCKGAFVNMQKDNQHIINDSSFSNQSLTLSRESNFYKNESKKLIEYIKNYAMKHYYNEYPKTTINFYRIGRRVGHGAFGKVNIGLHVLSGHIVAIKSFNKEKKLFSRSKINYEIRLMKKLRGHRSIVKLFEYIETEKYHCIIMENVSGGNLLSLIRKRTKLSESTSRFIFKQLIEAIKYIHSQGIAHRDIKPDNILIDLNNTIKLCDFGVGKEIKPGELIRDTCGTPAFVAPEILSDVSYDPFLTDIWSSGVVLYSMLSGFFPFIGNNDYELHKRITSGKFEDIQGISAECNDLIHRILEVDPSKRITLNEILNHKWMSNNSNNEQLFTNAERIIFSKLNVDYRIANKEDIIENFTYKNIDSELENENQNAMTRSVVNVPYNTKIGPYDDDEIFYEDLNIEDTIMRFLPKVNELNRNYEINNNSEADQGYTKKQKGRGLMSSFNNSYNKEEMKKEQVNKNNNNQSDNKANDNTSDFSSMNKKNTKKNIKDTVSTNSVTFCIDESAIKFVEDFGFRREFIMRSLEGNELNHATACYYLKLSLLNE